MTRVSAGIGCGCQPVLIIEGRFSPQQWLDFMWKHHPDRAAARNLTRGTPEQPFPVEGTYTADNAKSLKDLGVTYRGTEEMLADTYRRYEELENQPTGGSE